MGGEAGEGEGGRERGGVGEAKGVEGDWCPHMTCLHDSPVRFSFGVSCVYFGCCSFVLLVPYSQVIGWKDSAPK